MSERMERARIAEQEADLVIESESEVESTPLEYDISVYPADFTLEVLHQKWIKKEIITPEFQRGYVWTPTQASRLIESFLMGLPVPPIFLCINEKEEHIVIDGLQRLRTVFSFFEGSFAPVGRDRVGKPFRLTGINKDSERYGMGFEDLDEVDQRRLKNSVLRCVIIKQLDPGGGTSMYHIFERLNTGGTPLNDQEVRNCVYTGKLNDSLIELNKDKDWRDILGKQNPDKRQNDVQLILRYMALLHRGDKYGGSMKEFLSEFMSRHKDPPSEFLDAQESLFKKTCAAVVDSLGKRPFTNKNAMRSSVFDSVFVAFAKNVSRVPDDIKSRFSSLVKDEEFLKSTHTGTTHKSAVNSRMSRAEAVLFG